MRSEARTVRNAANSVVLNEGRILVQRACWEGQDRCFLPGGGQHPGETLGFTVRREVHEETGLDVTPQRLLWLCEYIGSRHGGAPEDHRVEAIFLCRPEGDPEQLGGHAADDVQTGLEWVELKKVTGLNLLPHGLRPLIAGLAHGKSPTRYLVDLA
ncbi:NUDIX domain-containing protein [Streptomyces antibioticus]|uniref:NUDIX domain-containing protein n=1 Tax=Streptomyces antibioticus TaxID=1890 RepID=UPI0036B15255